ncbi:hypothetical protein K440DRAFT_296069 [Wilcoxina mikolae CBS 423.85]|nr:hypothetical protein K440DRAFT_296069 [Wilcoxina mikolae CBS 423.85]
MQPSNPASTPATATAAAASPTLEAHNLHDYYPHFLTLTALIWLLGPSAATITLILSITLITACVILRPPLPSSITTSHSAAVVAAATADMNTTQEIRAFYYGYLKGFEDARHGGKEDVGEELQSEDARSESTSTTRKGSSRAICGPAVGWRERHGVAFSRPGSTVG